MSTLIESLKRLFLNGKVTLKKLQQMQDEGKITEDELVYITANKPSGDLEELQQYHEDTQAILPKGV